MNTPISFELAKLLKEKYFNEPCRLVYDNWGHIEDWYDMDREYHRNSEKNTSVYYSAPTIAEVVMWLHEKHGVWISSLPVVLGTDEWGYEYKILYLPNEFKNAKRRSIHLERINSFKEGFSSYSGAWYSPTKAYEAAIKYTLQNIIQ